MKKFFIIALAAMSMTFVSCKKDVEAQAKEYATKAIDLMKSGDNDKLAEFEKEVEAWSNGLSAEDQAKAKKVMEDEVMKALPELLGAAMGAGVESVEDAADAAEEAADAVEEAVEAVEEAAAE